MRPKIHPTSRFYESKHDLLQMQSLLMEGRYLTDDWRYPHVGDLLFWFFMVASHLNPHEHIRLWHAGNKLVGYAMLGEDPSFDCQVLPDFAWHGIEQEALEWSEFRIAELMKLDAEKWGGPLVSGARQDDARRIAFLEKHGFRLGVEFSEVNMLCDLTPEIRVDCTDDDKFPVVEGVAAHFKSRYPTIDVDGVRILFPGGWGLVRASNTQPILVVRFEADTPANLDRIQSAVREVLRQHPSVQIDF